MIGPRSYGPPPNTKPCACGHPQNTHRRRQWREAGIKRTVANGPCERTDCACAGYQRAETVA